MTRLLRITLLSLLIIAGLLAALIYSLTWRPADKETLPVSCVAPPRHCCRGRRSRS